MKYTNVTYLAFCVLFVSVSHWTAAEGSRVKPVSVESENGDQGRPFLLRHQNATAQERRLRVPIAIRLNAGGPAFVDKEGNSWDPDDAFAKTGKSYKTTKAIEDTPKENQVLYQYERWDELKGKRLKYTFDLPNGRYLVKLHFAENYFNKIGDRVFDIWIQGARIWESFDILASTGGRKYRPVVRGHVATVQDGELIISFQHKTQNTKVNGIEILSYYYPSPAPTCTRQVVDFSQTALGDELIPGNYVSNQWEKLGMIVSASGDLRRPRLYNTSDVNGLDPDLGSPNMRCSSPGPGIGLGGEPGMEGENCDPQGNVLIIQDPEQTDPSDNKDGGTITFAFPDLTDVDEMGLLDIDYESFIKVIVKNKGVGFRKLPVINVPLLGDNSFQTVPINAKRVKKVQVDLGRSGAVTSISFCAKNLSEYEQCIRDCPSHYCTYESPEDRYNLTCSICHGRTNAGCSENSVCRSRINYDYETVYPPGCYLREGESCSTEQECVSELCDPGSSTCWECAPLFYHPSFGERKNWRCQFRETCARIDGVHKCLLDVIEYDVDYIENKGVYKISSSDAQDAIDDCENNRTVVLKNLFNAPVAICPGLGTSREGDGFMGFGDTFNFFMTSDENVTMTCNESTRRCRVVYRFPPLDRGVDCTRNDQCASNDCCEECRNNSTGTATCK